MESEQSRGKSAVEEKGAYVSQIRVISGKMKRNKKKLQIFWEVEITEFGNKLVMRTK